MAVSSRAVVWSSVVRDGTLRAWGDSSSGELGNGTTTSPTTPVEIP